MINKFAPKLYYISSPCTDLDTTIYILENNDSLGITENLKDLGFSDDEIDQMRTFNSLEGYDREMLEEDLLDKVVSCYKKRYEYLENQKESFQKDWDIFNDLYFSETSKITGSSWRYLEYYIYLRPFFSPSQGVVRRKYDWTEVSANSSVEDNRYVTAHELLMSHMWMVLYKIFGKSAWDDDYKHYWGLNELTTSLILLKTATIKERMFPETNLEDEVYMLNYPKLFLLKSKIAEIYEQKYGDFVEYLKATLALIDQTYPNQNVQVIQTY